MKPNMEGRKRAERLARIYRARGWRATEHDLRLWRKTRVRCSCPLCGNPWRHFGEPTVQERREEWK